MRNLIIVVIAALALGGCAQTSATSQNELSWIAYRTLGPMPKDATDTAYRYGYKRPPAPGCVAIEGHSAYGYAHVRWRCPPGTIKRLGW